MDKLSPLPVKNEISYTIGSDKHEVVTIKVLDLDGQLIKVEQKQLIPGNNELKMELEYLAKGFISFSPQS